MNHSLIVSFLLKYSWWRLFDLLLTSLVYAFVVSFIFFLSTVLYNFSSSFLHALGIVIDNTSKTDHQNDTHDVNTQLVT